VRYCCACLPQSAGLSILSFAPVGGQIFGGDGDVRKGWWLVLAGLLLLFGGAWRAAQV